MNDERQRAYTLQVLAESERLIAEADALLARQARMLAAKGLDREQMRRRLEALPAAEQEKLRQQVAQVMEEADEHVRQARAHAQFNHNNPSAAPRLRRMRSRV